MSDLTKLSELLCLLREQGVTEYADETLVIKLGEKPVKTETDPYKLMAQERDAKKAASPQHEVLNTIVQKNPQYAHLIKQS